jgi:CBS domain-containing protein
MRASSRIWAWRPPPVTVRGVALGGHPRDLTESERRLTGRQAGGGEAVSVAWVPLRDSSSKRISSKRLPWEHCFRLRGKYARHDTCVSCKLERGKALRRGVAEKGERREQAMKVEHLMTTDVESCTLDATLADAAMIMWRRDCGFVPVIEETGTLAGVVTDRDICMAATTKHCAPASIPVGAIMNKKVVACAPTDDIATAMHRMAEAQVRRLPVVDKAGRMRGALSLNDLIIAAEPNARRAADAVTYTAVLGVLKPISAHRLPAKVGAA